MTKNKDLVIELSKCKYLCIKANKFFCGLFLVTGDQIYGPSQEEIDPKLCNPQDCHYYVVAEQFLPREIKEKR